MGSSVNIESRFATHLRELRKGTHHAGHLQNSYNKYGRDSYVINVLLECDPEELIAEEQKELDKGFDYNSSPTAGNTLGFRLSKEKREIRSKERKKRFQEDEEYRNHILNMSRGLPKPDGWKRKMSQRLKGVPKTEKHVERMAKSRAVLSEEQVREIRRRCDSGETQCSVARSMGISKSQVQRVASRERYNWVN